MLGRVTFLGCIAIATAAACHVYVDDPPPPRPYAYGYGTGYRTAPAPPQTEAAPTSTRPPPPRLPPYGTSSSYDLAPPPRRSVRSPTAACLDANPASVPDCAVIGPTPSACAPPAPAERRCQGMKTYFDAKVAANAISCLAGLTGTQLCDVTRLDECSQVALAEACLDSSVAQLCQIAQKPCGTTASVCAASVSGLNDQGQQAVAECVARGCPGGLDGCLSALTLGSAR